MTLNEKSRNIRALFVFLLCLTSSVLILCGRNNISMIADRVGDMASPAYLAGLDWKELVSQTSYYGPGFKWMFFVAFKLSDNPYHIYAAIQAFYALVHSIIYTLLFIEGAKYWEMPDSVGMILLFPVISILHEVHPMSSEPTLTLAFAILTLLLLKALRAERRSRVAYSIIIPLWLVYMLTLHERCFIVIIAFAVMVVFDSIYRRKCMFVWPVSVITFMVGLLIEKKIISVVTQTLWGTVNISNTSVIPSGIGRVFSFEGIKASFSGFISNFSGLSVKTLGFAAAGAFIFIYLFIRFIKKDDGKKDSYKRNRAWILVFILATTAIIITMAGTSVTGAKSIVKDNKYGYKFYVYIRYYIAWAPVWMISITVLWNKIRHRVKLWIKLIIPFSHAGLGALFLAYYYPLLKSKETIHELTGNNYRMYLLGIFHNQFPKDDFKNILYSLVVGIAVMMLFILNRKLTAVMVSGLMLAVVMYGRTNGFSLSKPSWYSTEDSIYAVIRDIAYEVEVPQDIYCTKEFSTRVFTLQYLLNRHTLHNSYPDPESEGLLIVTWSADDEYSQWLSSNGFARYKVGKNRFLWTNDSDLANAIERRLSN